MSDIQNTIVKGDKKIMNAWAFYDWANSVYPLVITTAIFPIFYESYISEKVSFFGFDLVNTTVITTVSAIYFLLIVFLLPILTGIADASGNKKAFMRFFCYLGALSCMSLALFDKDHLELSMISFVLAGIGFWSSLVFYNAYLPEVAEEKDHDKLSAKGFSMGYVGSAILLIVCLAMVLMAPEGYASLMSRLSFVLTGLWWIGFSHVTFAKLPKGTSKISFGNGAVKKGFDEIKKVWREVNKTVRLKRFLTSFFVYSMAVQTIMLMAVYFGTKEIDWGVGEEAEAAARTGLIISVLLIQIIAIPGAVLLSKVSNVKGNLFALKLVIAMWVVLCLSAFVVTEPVHFYIIASFVGLVMGGTQSLSRSTYSKYIPEGTKDTSSYFSFYDISEKMGIVIGMFSYGFIEQLTGSMRNSIVALVVFFAFGLILLFRVPEEEVELEKENVN